MARTTVLTALLTILSFICCRMANAAAPVTVMNPGNGFSFIGCYNELQNSRALADATLLSSQEAMTVEVCAQFCQSYTFMGVEYGTECEHLIR